MSDFIQPSDSDPLPPYPAEVSEPPADGPIIYPPDQPGDPSNVVPFQRETGLDPSKLPSLKEALGPKLRLLPGGAGGPNPPVLPANNPQSLPSTQAIVQGRQMRFAATPETPPPPEKPQGMSTTTVLLMVAAAAGVAYWLGKSKASDALNGPLVADMEDVSEEGEE